MTLSLMRQTLTTTSWQIVFFLLLACLIPFAGTTAAFRDSSNQILHPFGFSLLTPTRTAFGPREMLLLGALLKIPALLSDWRRSIDGLTSFTGKGPPRRVPQWTYPFSVVLIFAFYLALALPILGRSSAFPGIQSIGLTVLDLLLVAVTLAWGVDLALMIITTPRMRPLMGWITAGALYLGLSLYDAFLIPPQARGIVEEGFSAIAWHGVLAVAALTIHTLAARPITLLRRRVTL
jgi:hypothetical protein